MPLPKIDLPTFEVELPTTGKKLLLRPFTVKEEKILLIAGEDTESTKNRMSAIIQVVNNCILDDTDVIKMAIVDIEYVFVQLRAKSVSNISTIVLRDLEDGQQRKFDIDLEKIEIVRPEAPSNICMITDTIGMTIGYPRASMLTEMLNAETLSNHLILKHCLINIFDQDNVYDRSEMDEKELDEFIDGITTTALQQVTEFLDSVPYMKYDVEYKNNNDKVVKYPLRGIDDFF